MFKKQNRYIIFALVLTLVNGLFYLYYNHSNNTVLDKTEYENLYELGKYEKIVSTYTAADDEGGFFYYLLSHLKVSGLLDDWDQYAQGSTDLTNDQKKIFRLLSLVEKDDIDGALSYAEKITSDDDRIRSLFLQIRSELYLKLGNYSDAGILALDSSNLDVLASRPLLILAIAKAKSNQWSEVDGLLVRLDKIGYVGDNDYYYYKGLNAFHKKNYNDMNTFFDLVDKGYNDYYELLMTKGRSLYNSGEYIKGIEMFDLAHEYADNKDVAHMLRKGKSYIQLEKWIDAVEAFQAGLVIDTQNIELLVFMTVPLEKSGNLTERDELIKKIDGLLYNNTWRYTIFLWRLMEVGDYKNAFKYAVDAIDISKDNNDVWLQKEIIDVVVETMLDSLLTNTELDYRGDLLVRLQFIDSKVPSIYLSLVFMFQGDMPGGLRALQISVPDATERDVQTITMLHHLLIEDTVAAAKLLQEWEVQDPLDLDYLWFKRYLASSAGDTGLLVADESEAKLLLLENISQADADNMEGAFDKHFTRRLKYMKKYYIQ